MQLQQCLLGVGQKRRTPSQQNRLPKHQAQAHRDSVEQRFEDLDQQKHLDFKTGQDQE